MMEAEGIIDEIYGSDIVDPAKSKIPIWVWYLFGGLAVIFIVTYMVISYSSSIYSILVFSLLLLYYCYNYYYNNLYKVTYFFNTLKI